MIFYQRYYPEVYERSGWQFRKVWPPAQWVDEGPDRQHFDRRGPQMQIVGGFADLTGRSHGELICLEDRLQTRPQQALGL